MVASPSEHWLYTDLPGSEATMFVRPFLDCFPLPWFSRVEEGASRLSNGRPSITYIGRILGCGGQDFSPEQENIIIRATSLPLSHLHRGWTGVP